jgi:large subunit ribosomal protein L6
MSRIGKQIIDVPSGVKVNVEKTRVVVEGPKGKLETPVPEGIRVEQSESTLEAKRDNDSKRLRSLHGLTRALLANAVNGVTQGFEQKLDVVGIGYRAERRGDYLNLSLGHSHPLEVPVA